MAYKQYEVVYWCNIVKEHTAIIIEAPSIEHAWKLADSIFHSRLVEVIECNGRF